MASAAVTIDEDDVQALVLQGYGKLRAAAFLVLQISEPTEGWLSSLLPRITAGAGRPEGAAVNVAFTASGLAKLGLAFEVVAGFSLEFQEGMTSPHRRRLLGDEEAAAPENWAWGGPAEGSVDALLMLYATDEAQLATMVAEQKRAAAGHGLRVLAMLDTQDIGFGEHFGFRDGLSQPELLGTSRVNSDTPERDRLAPGEFLLGYRNEHGQYQRTPLVDPAHDPGRLLADDASGSGRRDFGRNGSYLVVRTLDQDVPAFWKYMDGATRDCSASSDGAAHVQARTALAARMVGRWPSGAPLTLAPDTDVPELAEVNDFAYHAEDGAGLACPIGAHVRRTNPRDSLPPKPGTSDSVAVGKRHRLLRRGRTYGPPIDLETALAQARSAGAASSLGDHRGLHFLALCADIARQFEFVTHTWALNPNFAGLYDDADPILGGHQPAGRTFTTQATPVRKRVHDVPPFVTVRGGAYLFLPGMRALRYLANRAGAQGGNKVQP